MPHPHDWILLAATLDEMGKSHLAGKVPSADDQPPNLFQHVYALQTVTKFLAEQPAFYGNAGLGLLLSLQTALIDLNNHGKVNSMLKPKKVEGRTNPGKDSAHGLTLGQACAAVALLRASGVDHGAAITRVSKALQRWAKDRKQKVSPQTVGKWFERAKEGVGPGMPESAVFAYRRLCAVEPDTTAAAKADVLLYELERLAT